jgi:insertion element IS1 protein InsB
MNHAEGRTARYQQRYTQRIEAKSGNLRQHLANLGRKSPVVLKIRWMLHDKVIGII